MQPRIRRSEKRDAIYAALCGTKTHPSVEWIYSSLKPEYPDLSLGTVYRNLAAFKAEGRVITVGVVGGQEHYDADVSDHHHLICRRCGAVLDVDVSVTVERVAELEANGCVVDGCKIVFQGLCPECAGLENKTKIMEDNSNEKVGL